MPEPDTKNAAQGAAETPQQTGPSPDSKEKTAASPSETARDELAKLKENIEKQREEKNKRREFLKNECTGKRSKESWMGAESDRNTSFIRGMVSSKVDESFAKYQSQFEAFGISDSSKIKEAVTQIVYDHYNQTGKDTDKTTAYAENELEAKINSLFIGIKSLFEKKIYPFDKAADCLSMFSQFTGLNFFENGSLQPDQLEMTLRLDKSNYEFFLKSFEQYLIISAELEKLKKDEADLGKNTGKPAATPKPGPSPEPIPGTAPPATPEQPPPATAIKLKNKARIVIAASSAETDAAIRKAVYDQLRDTADARTREAAANRMVEDIKKLNPQPGETFEISEDGSWGKIDTAKEEAEKKKAQQEAGNAAPSANVPAATTKVEKAADKISAFITKITEWLGVFIDKIMGYITAFTDRMGITGSAEFSNLNESEKKEMQEFKKAAEKTGLNMETLHPLFIDAEQCKKILKIKTEKNISWDDYMKKYLTGSESDELKNKKELKADKLAEMFTTPVTPEPGPTDTQPTPGNAQPPTSSS